MKICSGVIWLGLLACLLHCCSVRNYFALLSLLSTLLSKQLLANNSNVMFYHCLIAILQEKAGAQQPPPPLNVTANYTSNFSTLQGSTEGAEYPFPPGTVPGWSSSDQTYRVSAGATNAGGKN